MNIRYNKQNLIMAVAKSQCISDVIRILKPGNVIHGASHNYVKKKIDKYHIDISHFASKHITCARGSDHNKKPADKVLIVYPLDRKVSISQLRRALFDIGREYKCEQCNNDGKWCDNNLVLQVDHINGTKSDNRAENLRFLCPNCHSQTSNYKIKNCKQYKNKVINAYVHKKKKQRKIKIQSSFFCTNCNKKILKEPKSGLCGSCFNLSYKLYSRKVIDRPPYNILMQEVDKYGYCNVGKKYGVSDNAIRKWLKIYEKNM